jgi:translation initiation factor 3 subunit M
MSDACLSSGRLAQFRCDALSQLEVVQQLQKDKQYAPLHRLLQIVARETYTEFLAFSGDASTRTFMEKHDLSVDACARKMRLLTLVSLGHANKELTYQAVAASLKVEVADVEDWVMQAIGSGLLTAKMDQVREVVAVSMCAERDFGQKQWERLHGSLVDWRDSISNLLEVLKSSRAAA